MHIDINRKKLFGIILDIYIFLTMVIILFIIMYLIGSFQVFLDNTQLYLLSILSILSVLHLVSGILLLIGSFLQESAKKSKRRRIGVIIVSLFFSFSLFLTLRLIQTWLRY